MVDKKVRLQKWLAQQGVGSRRAVEKMIAGEKIKVNGELIKEQGIKIAPDRDRVEVEGVMIKHQDERVYFWVNKPKGVISAVKSDRGEKTVTELIDTQRRIFPVGRLDKDSTGLMLLTNDGMLTHRLTHPKFHLNKTYHVLVYGLVSQKQLYKMKTGVELSEGTTAPAVIRIFEPKSDLSVKRPRLSTWLEFVIHEGKHRQIRRMCQAVGLRVLELDRVKIDKIALGELKRGNYREATKEEIDYLRLVVGLTDFLG